MGKTSKNNKSNEGTQTAMRGDELCSRESLRRAPDRMAEVLGILKCPAELWDNSYTIGILCDSLPSPDTNEYSRLSSPRGDCGNSSFRPASCIDSLIAKNNYRQILTKEFKMFLKKDIDMYRILPGLVQS